MRRREIWSHSFKSPDKRRPVLVLSRQEVIGLLHTVTVAPITSTICGAPSEVLVGIDEGLKHDSAVNLDHVQTLTRHAWPVTSATRVPPRCARSAAHWPWPSAVQTEPSEVGLQTLPARR